MGILKEDMKLEGQLRRPNICVHVHEVSKRKMMEILLEDDKIVQSGHRDLLRRLAQSHRAILQHTKALIIGIFKMTTEK